ncbi:MAG: GNAT family N-acetyltransferase [Notoacmeibacter sp.]
MTIFHTARLTLTPSVPADAAELMSLESDPDVMRYLNGGQAIDHSKPPRDMGFSMPRGTEEFFWTARRHETNSFVGWFYFGPDQARVAELGYRLRRSEWGQGLAAEGGKALIDWGFSSGLYDRITANTMTVNLGSRRVMEKIGMHYVRTFQPEWDEAYEGTELGEVEYAIERPK